MEILTPALITASVSLVVSLMTLFQFFKNKRFQEDQANRASNRAFTTKLYDLRLENYPRAFEIVDAIYREKGGQLNPVLIRSTCDDLIKWKTGIINLIISNEARRSFYVLRDLLLKNPAAKDSYSVEQSDKINTVLKDFKRQLRRDVGFMFREEKERRGKD